MTEAAALQDMLLLYASEGNAEKLKLLLTRHPQLDLDFKEASTGDTPLMKAAARSHLPAVRLLLQHGADATLLNSAGQSVLDVGSGHVGKAVLERPADSSQLWQTCWQANAANLRLQLRAASPSDARSVVNRDACPALILLARDLDKVSKLAAQFRIEFRPIEALELLLAAGVDLSAREPHTEKTALHLVAAASCQQARPLLAALARAGADVESRDSRSYTALHCACFAKSTPIIKELLLHS